MTDEQVHEWLREEFKAFRTAMHEELAGIRKDISGLETALRNEIPRIAVLESRVNDHDKDIQELKDQRLQDKQDRQWSTSLKVTAALSLLAMLATFVVGILNLLQGG